MERSPIPIALTVAGSDPSGGAGLQADLKTFHQHRVYGASVVTLLTVQSTTAVSRVEVMSAELVDQQLAAVLGDFRPDAVKTGALGNAAVIEVVARRLQGLRVVVDPVMVSKHGHALLGDEARATLVRQLLPRALLLTPNAHEAEALLGRPVRTLAQARDAARALQHLGATNVLLKGGHLEEPDAVDVLAMGASLHEFHAPRLATTHTHGTGCTLASAITAWLARGTTLEEAVTHARAFISRAIETAPLVGQGVGPVNHFAAIE